MGNNVQSTPSGEKPNPADANSILSTEVDEKYVDCDCPVCTEGWERLSNEKMNPRQMRVNHIIERHPDMYKKCPSCSSILKRPVDDSIQPCQFVRCSRCAPPQHFCWSCLGPWVFSNEASAGSCSNKSCVLVATLLNCDMVVDNRSAVFGCPLFRACPKCRGLIMHTKGCKNVTCSNCKHRFCFICLEAIAAGDACSYGICKKGRAGRQSNEPEAKKGKAQQRPNVSIEFTYPNWPRYCEYGGERRQNCARGSPRRARRWFPSRQTYVKQLTPESKQCPRCSGWSKTPLEMSSVL